MKKWMLATIVVVSILGTLAGPVQGSGGFSIAPSKLEVTVSENSSVPVYVYLTSSFDGELIIGKEDIPYRVEPASITVSSHDVNRKVELTIYNDTAVEAGEYPGKLTFLAYTGKNVAYGIKADILVRQVENKGSIQKLIDRITGKNDNGTTGTNYLLVAVAVIVVLAVLMVGIVIGRKSRKSSGQQPGEQESTKNGDDE
jgi:hypothetical protein